MRDLSIVEETVLGRKQLFQGRKAGHARKTHHILEKIVAKKPRSAEAEQKQNIPQGLKAESISTDADSAKQQPDAAFDSQSLDDGKGLI
jgi:hypothetical protein